MNHKAEKFQDMLEEKQIEAFQSEEMKDDYHTTVFHSNVEVKGQRLPLWVLVDDSIYTIIRVGIATKVVEDKNRAAVQNYLDGINRHYKIFKYYTAENGDLILDCCLTATDDGFDPLLIQTILNVILEHLQEAYADIMKVVWAEA